MTLPFSPVRVRLVRWSALIAVSLLLVAACMRFANRAVKSNHHVLSPSTDTGPGGRNGGAFGVVFAGPEGEANEVSELSLVFSRPLRKLELAGARLPPIVISPPIPGRWSWVGTRALHFVPETPHLPGSTHYVVTVPGELRALDGTQLGNAYRLEFSTPRLKLVESVPYAGARGLETSTTFDLHFNQPVDPERFRTLAKLVATHDGRTEPLAFDVVRPDPEQQKRLQLRPLRPLPIHARIVLTVSEQLTSIEGPLAMSAPLELAVETYGPLSVEALKCDREAPHDECAPGGSWSLELNNPVTLRELKGAMSVTPAVPLRFEHWSDESSHVSYLGIAAPFRAGTRYTLRLNGSLKDVHGQSLARAFTKEMKVDDYFPAVEIGVQGRVLDPRNPAEIPIGSLNVDHYVLRSAALTPEDALRFSQQTDPETRARLLADLPKAQTLAIRPGAASNQLSKHTLNLASILGAGARGAVAVDVDYERDPKDERSLEHFKILQLTDLAISAKLSTDGSLVWVTRISSGEPVAAASVRIVRADGAPLHYETDAQGIARIPGQDFRPPLDHSNHQADALIVVQSGADWTFEAARDVLPSWRLSQPTDWSGVRHTYGLVFTERGIYRPGDMVQVKGIVRRELRHGNATPSGEDAQVELYSPESEQVATARVKLSRFGTFSTQLKLPEAARLGDWQIRVSGFDQTIYESFDVSEYRPVEFQVGVASERPSYVRGDTARWSSHADFLFGAPMTGANVRYTVSRERSYFEVPNALGFVTTAQDYHDELEQGRLPESQLLAQTSKLDARGAIGFSAKLDFPAQFGPELLTAEAEVTDLSRQSVASSSSAIVHPAEFYIGLKEPEDYFVAAPGKAGTSVVALSPGGERLSGKSVKVELVSRHWTNARGSGDAASAGQLLDRVLGSCNVITGRNPVPCALDVPEAGYYFLRATAKDARGNSAESALAMYAIGERGTAFRDSDALSVELKSNKKTYQIGETARVLIKSPFAEADALVTVERAGIYSSTRVHVRGPTPTIDVPITEELRPNAFVAVHLVRARAADETKERGAPYRVGYTELRIDPEARRLSVALRPNKTDFAPGAEISVDLDVKDRSGKAHSAEVTVYAVDEGVLSLIGYKVPDPIPVFTASRPLGVATLESRDALGHIALEALDGAFGADKGRDGGGGGVSPARRDFRQTAYFNPSVLTNADGKAQVRFKLPESLTTYRIMAVAVSEGDHYGFGAASVTTSKRLMARPALPRFLRSGDTLEAGVVVSAKGFDPGRLTVEAHATGIALLGSASQTLSVGRDGSVEVRFQFRADAPGKADFRFDVSAGTERDAVLVTRRIDSPATLEAVALAGSSRDSVTEALGDLSSVRPDVGQLELSVASTALVGLDAGVDQLVRYPYGCTEQLSSRLIPLVPLRELAKAFDIPLPLDLDHVVPLTVAQIIARQRGDGGFGLWPDSRESYPWVSAYALFVLGQVKLRHIAVPSRVFDQGKDYLRRSLMDPVNGYGPAEQAFVLDVLAEMGAPDAGYQQRLFDRRKTLPLFAKAFLLHALAISGGQRTLVQALRPELENALRIENDAAYVGENLGDEYAVLMDSQTRTAALVLRALLAVQPDHPLAAPLARGILAQRDGGTWRTTQETSYALLALDAYRQAQEKVVPDFQVKALLGQRSVLQTEFRGRSLAAAQARVGMDQLAGSKGASLVFDKSGSGTLFYQARLRYARRTLPTDTLDQGFFVQKGVRPVSAEGLPQALLSIADSPAKRLGAGDLVLTDLVIVSPSPRNFVVIDDPLAAGIEAIDSHLATSSVASEVGESSAEPCPDCGTEDDRDELAAGQAYFENYSHRELRDDRVLFFIDHMVAGMYHFRYLARATSIGKFVVPATTVQEMYTPETFGRNGATSLSIE